MAAKETGLMTGKLGSEMALSLSASQTQQAGGGPLVSGGQRGSPPCPGRRGRKQSKVIPGKMNIILKVLMAADRHIQPSGDRVSFGSGWQLTSMHAKILPNSLT